MDKLAKNFKLGFDKNNKYKEIVQNLAVLSNYETLKLDLSNREMILKYIQLLNVEKEKEIVCKYLGKDIEEKDTVNVSELSDLSLLKYLTLILRTVMWTQNGNLLLVKYSKNIWNTGWHNLAKQCRGKVIDLNTKQIVVYPFDKFFNLNEVDETKEERIQDLLSRAKEVYVTDKKDGSAIIVTKYKGKLIINTNGEFKNLQIDLAKKLFELKYKKFYENVPEGFTFVFELIHPDNRIVLDYGKEKKLYLLAVRNLKTRKLKSYPELCEIAKKYSLDITESFKYTNLFDFIEKALNSTEIREGWVFRVVTDKEDFMFKLKYQEYFKLARIQNVPSLKKLYNLMIENRIDDLLSVSESDLRTKIENDTQILLNYIENFKRYIHDIFEHNSELYGINRGELSKEQSIRLLTVLKDNPFSIYVMRYARGVELDELFNIYPKPSAFEKMFCYWNDLNGISNVSVLFNS